MGLVLMAALFAGCILGLIVAAIVGGAGVVLSLKSAKTRLHVWWCFAVVFLVVQLLRIVAVHEYPYAPVRPGSDYDVAMKNLFLQGFGYCASPGLASLLAALFTWFMPNKTANTPPIKITKAGSRALLLAAVLVYSATPRWILFGAISGVGPRYVSTNTV